MTEYYFAKDADLLICTPFYLHQAYAPHEASLAVALKLCEKVGIDAYFVPIMGDAYVWRVRNSFAHLFLNHTRAKNLIFIDSDHAWDIEGFANLLKAPVDIVGAAYPCKNNWEFWGVVHHVNEDGTPLVDPETGLIEAVKVPTGFMKISRHAFEVIQASEPDNFYNTDEGEAHHGFFNQICEDGVAHGEDISFGIRALRAGLKLWIEPRITIEHYGVEAHTGNYHDFLRRQPGGDLA